MTTTDWARLADDLTATLNLGAAPIAITFATEPPAGVQPFSAPMPAPTDDGRTGRVPAGCVFWMRADATFSTVAEDHANCSVGTATHGFKPFANVAGNDDIATLLDAGWVT